MSRRNTISLDEAWPQGWKDRLGVGPFGVGCDPATTEKKTSNPAAIAVTEKRGLDFIVRAVVRYRSEDPAVHRAMLASAIALGEGRRVRRVCIDATSERLFARDLRTAFAGIVPVELMIASEGIDYLGIKMSTKVYLGSLVVRALEDEHLVLPKSVWLQKDLRQAEGGTFAADVDENGNHADCFVAIAHSIHALTSGGGPAFAEGAAVGGITAQPALRPGLVGPLAAAGQRRLISA